MLELVGEVSADPQKTEREHEQRSQPISMTQALPFSKSAVGIDQAMGNDTNPNEAQQTKQDNQAR